MKSDSTAVGKIRIHHKYGSQLSEEEKNEAKTKRAMQKRLIAMAFCEVGYGMDHFYAFLKTIETPFSITRCHYKNLSSIMATEVYRLLQSYLKIEKATTITKIGGIQMKKIYTILFNCRQLMEESESATFIKFVRLAFNLQGEKNVEVNQAVVLYQTIQRFYQDKKDNKLVRGKQRNLGLEKEVLKRFMAVRSITRVQLAFEKEGQTEVNTNFIKRTMIKYLRRIIREIEDVYLKIKTQQDERTPLPILHYINCEKISLISTARNTIPIRIFLLELLFNRDLSMSTLVIAIQVINDCLQDHKNQQYIKKGAKIRYREQGVVEMKETLKLYDEVRDENRFIIRKNREYFGKLERKYRYRLDQLVGLSPSLRFYAEQIGLEVGKKDGEGEKREGSSTADNSFVGNMGGDFQLTSDDEQYIIELCEQ